MPSSVELKRFEATKKMKGVMGRYFTELMDTEAPGKKIAWCTSLGPAELLRAMGFEVYFPENHGAMLGATRMATDLILWLKMKSNKTVKFSLSPVNK